MMKQCLALLSLSLLGGCSVDVKVPQYEAAAGFVKQIIQSQQPVPSDRAFLWTARLGEEGRLLRVHTEQNLFVFASSEDDAIAFDGWQIRSFIGFGSSDMVTFIGQGPEFQFVTGPSRANVRCFGWEKHEETGELVKWVQRCENLPANEIELDQAGAIVAIRHLANASGAQFILEKVPTE